MNELFGIPMTTIMWALLVVFGACLVAVAAIFLTNRTMFRVGLRNIPRRRAQSTLVVLGLMLATLIITAAFTTGDTLDYSITSGVYDNLQRTDLRIDFRGEGGGDAAPGQIYADAAVVDRLSAAFADDPDIAGFFPFLFEPLPAVNRDTRLAEPAVVLAGIDPAALARFGGLRLSGGGRPDLAALGEDEVLVSERAANQLDARPGHTLLVYAQGQPHALRVAGIVKDELASGVLGFGGPDVPGGMAARLTTVQRIVGHPGQVNSVSVALKGEGRETVTRSGPAAQRLEAFLNSAEGRAALGLGELRARVDTSKADGLKQAETFGNLFTTFFLVLGLFSIAAGVLLIFMIFVMLAAERRTEMGMARAIGTQRLHLVQAFTTEGMAYNLLAGAVGAALGVLTAFLLVIGGTRLVAGEELAFMTPHVTARSLVIGYCLGVVLTFVTVVTSSVRVSRLNIVAAIRGLDDHRPCEGRHRTRWRWVLLGLPALLVPPLGLYWLLRKGFGLPWAWIVGPTGLVLGGLLMALGKASGQLFPFSLGISLLPLATAAVAGYYRAPARLTWSAVGVFLAVYWLMPGGLHDRLFGKMDGNIEMFVLSGIMIVTGSTLLLVFNARLLTRLIAAGGPGAVRTPLLLAALAALAAVLGAALGDRGGGLGQLCYLLAVLIAGMAALSLAALRFPRLAPAFKMGIAYPLANRFRTGMTIAMFSLIVFSITMMSVLNANFSALFSGEEARGGWDVTVDTNRNNPVPDLAAALRDEGTFDPGVIAEAARTTGNLGVQEARVAGNGDWQRYPVRAGDDAFFAANQAKLDLRARGYASDREVFEAVRTQPNLALIDILAVPNNGNVGAGPDLFKLTGLTTSDKEFDPITVEVRDPVTGRQGTLTVIGVFSSKIPQRVLFGLYTNERSYAAIFGPPEYRRFYLRLQPGANGEAVAKGIKAALVTRGVQARSIATDIDEQMRLGRGFNRIFQAFMGLGLFVGIAALGVIAFRSVVERRQQIGMLRALGYQRGTVALTFVLESSFVALMGILSGVVGAAILARNLFNSDAFTGTSRTGFSFFIPWGEVVVFVAIAYLCALLMTWWPSRGAARVPVAEALRYE